MPNPQNVRHNLLRNISSNFNMARMMICTKQGAYNCRFVLSTRRLRASTEAQRIQHHGTDARHYYYHLSDCYSDMELAQWHNKGWQCKPYRFGKEEVLVWWLTDEQEPGDECPCLQCQEDYDEWVNLTEQEAKKQEQALKKRQQQLQEYVKHDDGECNPYKCRCCLGTLWDDEEPVRYHEPDGHPMLHWNGGAWCEADSEF